MNAKSMASGFLVVARIPECRGEAGKELNPRYSGVDRVPAYPSTREDENDALDAYVFGDFKDGDSNMISEYGKALELLRMFPTSSDRYEVILCCEGGTSQAIHKLTPVRSKPLGYDVAVVRGDYWSVVNDFCGSQWAAPFVAKLNENGLFGTREVAETYLQHYVKHKEADWNMCFDVVFVLRCFLEGLDT